MNQNRNHRIVATVTAVLSVVIAGLALLFGEGILLPLLSNNSVTHPIEEQRESLVYEDDTSDISVTSEEPNIEIQRPSSETNDGNMGEL